jgi:pimeloyl-ACP methyl ester carboxylesterase
VDANATPATLVFLHEGLGSITMWRDFPAQLCQATGLPGFVYAREGYGASTPLASPRAVDYLHREAGEVLPQILAATGIVRPILVGHSDGASIALLHAGLFPGVAGALVVLAPHLFVEPLTVEAIDDVNRRFHQPGDNRLRAALSRHHQSLDSAFGGWAGIWLNPDFLAFNIEAEVARIRCPVLAIQGAADPYGSARQVERIAQLCRNTAVHLLPDCQHNPHLEQGARTLELCKAFIEALYPLSKGSLRDQP